MSDMLAGDEKCPSQIGCIWPTQVCLGENKKGGPRGEINHHYEMIFFTKTYIKTWTLQKISHVKYHLKSFVFSAKSLEITWKASLETHHNITRLCRSRGSFRNYNSLTKPHHFRLTSNSRWICRALLSLQRPSNRHGHPPNRTCA